MRRNAIGVFLLFSVICISAAQAQEKPAGYINTYYLYQSQPMQPRTQNNGILTLTANGGRLITPAADLELDWVLNAEQKLVLTFKDNVVSTSYPVKSCGDPKVPQKKFNTIYQSMVIDVTDLGATGGRFATQLNVLQDYEDPGCPDQQQQLLSDPLVTTKAGLRQPAEFLRAGNINIPLSLKPTITEPLTTPAVNGYIDIQSAMINFNYSAGATNGTGTLFVPGMSSQGLWTYTPLAINWSVAAQERTLQINGNGIQLQLAYLRDDIAGWPLVSVINTDSQLGNKWFVAGSLDAVEQLAEWTVQNIPGIYDFRQIANAAQTKDYFWLELTANGQGLSVQTRDANADGNLSDFEIMQYPLRWQLSSSGKLLVRRYMTANNQPCLPAEFDPAYDAECMTYSERNMTLLRHSLFNNENVVSVAHQYTFFNTNRQVNWPARAVAHGGTLDKRPFFRTSTRPVTVKPLVLGIEIPDDKLRDCLLQQNLNWATELKSLTCQGVNDISGLQYFPELTSLSLTGGRAVTNLSQLRTLKKVQYLDLSNNQLNDSQLLQLEGFDFAGLGELRLDGNSLTFVSCNILGSMQQLRKLSLAGNRLGSGLQLVLLEQLEQLDLTGATLDDAMTSLNMMSGHKNLKRLVLANLGFNHVDDLRLPSSVTELVLDSNPLTELNTAGLNPANLRMLSLAETSVSRLNFVSSLPQLHTLWLDRSKLQTLDGLTGQLQLARVYLRGLSTISCNAIDALQAADQSLVVYWDFCAEQNLLRPSVLTGQTVSAVEFTNAADNALGQWLLVDQQVRFVPAPGIRGWQRMIITIRYTDGTSRRIIVMMQIKADKRRNKLPWWLYQQASN